MSKFQNSLHLLLNYVCVLDLSEMAYLQAQSVLGDFTHSAGGNYI